MYRTLFEFELFMETVNVTTKRDMTRKWWHENVTTWERDVYIRDKPLNAYSVL